jgi:hypothetical protein
MQRIVRDGSIVSLAQFALAAEVINQHARNGLVAHVHLVDVPCPPPADGC